MDRRLLDLLVCPLCKGPLDYRRVPEELVCPADRLAFAVRDGIAVMLESEARALDANDDRTPTPAELLAAGAAGAADPAEPPRR
jgi:uncharacterized protein YbaR (Trm112 family)